MHSSSLRRKIVVLVLAVTLAVPWCAAAAPASEPPHLLSQLWQIVASLWGDTGCHLDPSGVCNQVDTGCHLDPDGRCGS